MDDAITNELNAQSVETTLLAKGVFGDLHWWTAVTRTMM